MKLLILNGPNLNLLGLREPAIYGRETYEDLKTLAAETAARLGFADSAYFSRCFKRAYGVTPRDFARHARKAAAAKAATNRYTTPPNVHVTKPDGEVE